MYIMLIYNRSLIIGNIQLLICIYSQYTYVYLLRIAHCLGNAGMGGAARTALGHRRRRRARGRLRQGRGKADIYIYIYPDI